MKPIKTWLDEKIENCKHPVDGENVNMGSVGGMSGFEFEDGSVTFPLVFVECKKCGYAYVGSELMGGQKESMALQHILKMVNSFHNIRYKRLKESNENKKSISS